MFQRNKSTISRHIKNIFTEGELTKNSVVANFATTNAGEIGHKKAMEKAKEEYRKYQVNKLTPAKKVYLEMIKDTEKIAKGKVRSGE